VSSPSTVAVDSANSVYVPTRLGIMKLVQGGTDPTTITFPGLFTDKAVAVDSAGDAFVTDYNVSGGRVLEVPAGTAGSPIPILTAGLYTPPAVAVQSAGTSWSKLFVTNIHYDQLCVLTNGETRAVAYAPNIPHPTGVAVDSAGDAFLADNLNNRIFELPAGATRTIGPLPFTGLAGPNGLAVDGANDLFVADTRNNRVLELAPGASTPTVVPLTGLKKPTGLAVDSVGDLFVADTSNNRIVELDAGTTTAVTVPLTKLLKPQGVAVDAAGDVFVADTGNNRLVVLPRAA
jgi:serine/threonine-protein kinase